MNTLPLVLTTTALSSAIAIGVMIFMKPGEGNRGGDGPDAAMTQAETEASARIDALEARISRLTEASIQPASGSVRTAVPTVDAEAIDAAVARHFERLAANSPTDAGSTAAAEASSDKAFLPKVLFEELRAEGNRDWDAIQAKWSSLTSEQQDELLAEYEALAKANPADANAQNSLGEAYVHRLMNSDMAGMMKFGQLAEASFDSALELDDHHWGARFNKAMSLSNQPAFLGKQPEAIEHFNTLIAQQEAGPSEPRHLQAYLFLGNLYAQTGDSEQARAVWERGAGRFPGSDELRKKLGR